MYNLFLDDVRTSPADEFFGYEDIEWTIVKDHGAFCDMIEERGLPSIVSFDHDLAEEHYNPTTIDYFNYKYETGLSSALYLIDYIINNKLEQPEIRVHSMNPEGRKNIVRCFEQSGFEVKMK